MRKVLTIAFVLFLVGCSHPAAGQRGGALSGNVAVATTYYQNNLSKCGDSYIAEWTFSDRSGSRLVELKGVKYGTSPIALSQADRLNGLEDEFESWIEPTAVRQTSSPRDVWAAWQDIKSVFRFRFVKVKGNWNVAPVSAGFSGISGYMAKYPCEELPGNPARLAREEAERKLVAQARQVGVVSFTCGPVRDFSGYGTQSISVTDASVTGISGLPETAVAFIDARFLSRFDKDSIDGLGIWISDSSADRGGSWGFRFRGPSAEANRDACYEAILASYERWRSRFPTLAKLPVEQIRARAEQERAQAEAQRLATERANAERQNQVRAVNEALASSECSERQLPVPSKANLTFVVPSARECWTPWLVMERPYFGVKESGNVLIQLSHQDGTMGDPFEDGPNLRWKDQNLVQKLRFKSLGKAPVTISITWN